MHFGEISPPQIWHALRINATRHRISESQWRGGQFLAEIGWREFAYHLLHHFPQTVSRPMQSSFERFPWRPIGD